MVNTITDGHLAILYISGASTAMVTEPTTQSGGNKTYTITAAAHRVMDPTATQTLNWSAGPTGTTITKNRLAGAVYSSADEGAHTLTITGSYLPMAAMLYARDFSMSIKPKVVDTTTINCASPPAYETKQRSLSELTGTIGAFFTPEAAATFTPAITEYFYKSLSASTVFALKFYVSANYELLAWVTVDTEAIKATINNVLDETVSFRGVADADGRVVSQL